MDLKQIFRGHAATLLERRATKAILCDVFNNDIPKINVLMSAYDIGIVTTIKDSFPLGNLERSNIISKLIKQYSMLEERATWAVDQWIRAIDNIVIREMIEVQEAFEKEQKEKKFVDNEDFCGDLELPSSHDDSLVPIDFSDKSEKIDYYTNVCLDKVKGKIFIPCGVGNTDNGFYICGIEEKERSVAPTVFALVYNYLIRNSCITQEDYPHYLNTISLTYQLNYQHVFRLMIIILQLIKNGIVGQKLNLAYAGKDEELDIAVAVINDYVARFSRLMRVKEIVLERVLKSKNPIKISLDKEKNGIYIEENKVPCNARELWYGEKINYQLDFDLLPDLEYFLGEISPFDTFKEGQFIAIKNMLGSNGHSICIMPTGSGKSLVFYFASLLQPLPMFILAPTEILIEDQIRNLKKFHRIDNVSHLKLTDNNDFSNFEMRNSLLYLTPSTFQNRHLLVKCRHINNGRYVRKSEVSKLLYEARVAPGPSISYVILDEIHCLSNWGHDFRPEYLMLSKFLNKFLDRVTFLGFTATANYTVVEDIQQQLNISQQNIFSPIEFDKYNVSYHFQTCQNYDEMIEQVCLTVEEKIRKNERTLVFTKNDDVSFKVAQAIGYEADVFQKDNTYAYHLFADEKCKVLVASEELGIGVNLPNIQNIIHFGLPVSKNEFVQEIGRAGRANENVNSYIFYLEPVDENVPQILLKRQLEIPNISQILNYISNDYSDCYRKLNNNIDSKEDLFEQIMQVYEDFNQNGKAFFVKEYALVNVETIKKYIFMLYTIGYVNDWYSYASNESSGSIEIMVDISASDHHFYTNPDNMLKRVRQRAIKYYETLGSNREQIVKTQRAADIVGVIKVYIDWYYSKFLYHHKEMFIDFLEFVETNKENDSEKITEDIREYFTLPFIEIKSDESYYSKLSLKEIANKVVQGIGRNTLVNVERINSNRYLYNLDCLLFFGNLKVNKHFEKSRFERIIRNTPDNQKEDLKDAISKVFAGLDMEGRFETIRYFSETSTLLGGDQISVCNALYQVADKDVIYYGVLAERLNRRLS